MPCTRSKTRNSQPKGINDTSTMLSHQTTTKPHNHLKHSSCVKRLITLGSIHKQVRVMLNIKFTLSGRGVAGLARDMTESRHISQSRVTAASATACLACYGYSKRSTGLTSCCCDNIVLVSLIFLGRELHILYPSTMCEIYAIP